MGVSGQHHTPARFTPGERTPGTHWTGYWVGPTAGLDAEARRKILCLCRGSNPDWVMYLTMSLWNAMKLCGNVRAEQAIYRLKRGTTGAPSKLAQTVPPLTCIWEIPGSNPIRDSLSVSPQSLQANVRTVPWNRPIHSILPHAIILSQHSKLNICCSWYSVGK
jgi:hypothetical protein